MSLDTEQHEEALRKMDKFSKAFNDAMNGIKNEEESYWEGLTTDQQMAAFNCVIRRLYDGEINRQRSYRGVLYDVFGFGPEAYARAQMAGFLAIHNSIMTIDQETKQLAEFARYLGVTVSEEKVDEFLLGKYL